MNKYDTLCLAGGGIKGFCTLGAIQAAIDLDIINNVTTYIGTSMGSILGYFLAIGYTPIEIIVCLHINKYLEKIENKNVVEIINGCGVINYNCIHESLEKMTLDKIGKLLTLGKLKEEYGKTLICCTYNSTICTTEYLGPDNYPDLPCLTALRMSSNLPIVFDRFKYMDNYYIDGGLVENLPIKKAGEIGKNVLGINFLIDENSLKDEPSEGILAYIMKLLLIQMVQMSKLSTQNIKDNCRIININSKVKNILDFNINHKMRLEMFSEGYESVKNFYKKIK